MFRYACGLPQREYLEWIEDRSTVTDIKMFDNPLVDRILCEPRVCLPVSALAVWMLLQAPAYGIMLFVEQVLFGAVAALTLVLADVAGERLKVPQMPTSVHFLLSKSTPGTARGRLGTCLWVDREPIREPYTCGERRVTTF